MLHSFYQNQSFEFWQNKLLKRMPWQVTINQNLSQKNNERCCFYSLAKHLLKWMQVFICKPLLHELYATSFLVTIVPTEQFWKLGGAEKKAISNPSHNFWYPQSPSATRQDEYEATLPREVDILSLENNQPPLLS